MFLASLGAALGPAPLAAQADLAFGASLRVYLVTVAPGSPITSRFGHSAIRVLDTATGADRAYGFAQSDLQRRSAFSALVQGNVNAGSSDTDADAMFERYRAEGRSVWIQELNLQPHERAALVDLLEHPGRRGMNSYRYDFFRANCTTQIRDILDEVLGGRLRSQTAGLPSEGTYRSLAAGLSRSHALLYALSNLLMADSVDRPITVWEEMFLPQNLRERLRAITVFDGEGRAVPLVRGEEVRVGAGRALGSGKAVSSTSMWAIVGILIGLAMALLGSKAAASDWARRGFSVLGGGWALTVGLLGVGLAAMWAFTDQTLVFRNENLLAVSPLSLLVAISAWGSERGMRRARLFAVAAAGLAGLGLVLKAFPGFDQDSLWILALTIPAHFGLAWGLFAYERGT